MLDRLEDTYRYEVWVTDFPDKSVWYFCQVDMTGFRNLRKRKHPIRVPQALHPKPIGSRPKDLAHCWDRMEDMAVYFKCRVTVPVKVYLLDDPDNPVILDREDYLKTTPRYHRRICEGYGITLPVDLYERVPAELRHCEGDFPNSRAPRPPLKSDLARRIESLEL